MRSSLLEHAKSLMARGDVNAAEKAAGEAKEAASTIFEKENALFFLGMLQEHKTKDYAALAKTRAEMLQIAGEFYGRERVEYATACLAHGDALRYRKLFPDAEEAYSEALDCFLRVDTGFINILRNSVELLMAESEDWGAKVGESLLERCVVKS